MMMKHKNKIIAGVIALLVLMLAFVWDGVAPEPDIRTTHKENTSVSEAQNPLPSQAAPTSVEAVYNEIINHPVIKDGDDGKEENKPQKADNTPITAEDNADVTERMPENSQSAAESSDVSHSEQIGIDINCGTVKDEYQNGQVFEDEPAQIYTENTVISDKELTCTMSVRWDTILNKIERLSKEKSELVPEDGVIYAEQTVTFYEGESVFNLLVREMKRNKIHLEFENTPVYNSAYIEGIGNLYEFDCGELSGWMYKVNGLFPNYGCSRYVLKEGDIVEWVYTCDLGADVGSDLKQG